MVYFNLTKAFDNAGHIFLFAQFSAEGIDCYLSHWIQAVKIQEVSSLSRLFDSGASSEMHFTIFYESVCSWHCSKLFPRLTFCICDDLKIFYHI